MKKPEKQIAQFAALIEAMAAEKRLIRDHLISGKDIAALEEKGVKFVKPI